MFALALALQACAAPGPKPADLSDAIVQMSRGPSLLDHLERGERLVRDLRAEEARGEFEVVLELLVWLPTFEESAELRRRAADGLVHVRGILQER